MTLPMPSSAVLSLLRQGTCIPAQPLALDNHRKFDEKHQRALTRYYMAAGSGGLAVAVHSTQFEIRLPQHGLLRPVLQLAMEEIKRYENHTGKTIIKVSGVVGKTEQAVREAAQAVELGYDVGLLSLGAMSKANDDELIEHCHQVSKLIPIVGFYLQPSVGGRILPASFWRRFAQIPNVVAIKMAPFNRYQTIDVVRAVAEAGRALPLNPTHEQLTSAAPGKGIALYTGNDDNIVCDLLGEWTFEVNGDQVTQRIVGGLLGHWAAWTHRAVDIQKRCSEINKDKSKSQDGSVLYEFMSLNRQVTDMNAAMFDPAHGFHGCIPGMHEILRRQGLMRNNFCLNPDEVLSPGQADELTRVSRAYPHLIDDDFVAANLSDWLK